MKKFTIFTGALILSLSVFAQSAERTAPNVKMMDDGLAKHLSEKQAQALYGSETPIWSEDFASGIASAENNYHRGRRGGRHQEPGQCGVRWVFGTVERRRRGAAGIADWARASTRTPQPQGVHCQQCGGRPRPRPAHHACR
mgnify:CR=1 FL=1